MCVKISDIVGKQRRGEQHELIQAARKAIDTGLAREHSVGSNGGRATACWSIRQIDCKYIRMKAWPHPPTVELSGEPPGRGAAVSNIAWPLT